MTESKIDNIPSPEEITDIFFTRELKNPRMLRDENADLRMMVKLRRNNKNISRLEKEVFSDDFSLNENSDSNADFIHNLKKIDAILSNMQRELKRI